MHAKNNNRPATALPLSADATASTPGAEAKAPARGLSAALGAALGGKGGKAQFAGGNSGAPHHSQTLNKAPKPARGVSRSVIPGKGHR